MSILIYGMVFVGSALMVYNIYTYVRYLQSILNKGYWEGNRQMLYFPLILLIMFLVGYVVVGIAGKPDIIMSGILFFGSVYVTIILAVLKSITSRVEESEKLEAKLKVAEESSRAKTTFLSHMSHEIRTPMNAIIGLNTLALKNPDLPDDTRSQLEKLDSSAHHLLELINDVLDMSRFESDALELRQDPFAFADLEKQVNGIIQGQCEEKDLNYEYITRGPLAPVYIGDITKLKQMLINLLGNAVKFTPEGTVSLEVAAEPPSAGRQRMTFIVRDTGVGIDADFLPDIFDPFAQEDSSMTNRYGGTGLGMSITKKLVDLMEGEISVESEKGKGTTFMVRLELTPGDAKATPPCAEAGADAGAAGANAGKDGANAGEAEANDGAAGANAGEAEANAGAAGEADSEPDSADGDPADEDLTGLRLLIAEDVELNAEILMDLLEMEGIDTDWAENGQIAVDIFAASEEYAYDGILMDMRMPEMDGLTATRTIRSLDRRDAGEIPIIALTANAFGEDIRLCLEAGMDAHLAKPVDAGQVCGKLRELTARKRKDEQGEDNRETTTGSRRS